MSVDLITLPRELSYGTIGGPGYNTQIVTTDSGRETRIQRWENARRRYDLKYVIRGYEDLLILRTFFLARRGAVNGFLFTDFADGNTTESAATKELNPNTLTTNLDQDLGVGDGTTQQFQLKRKYVDSGGFEVERIIKYPVEGNVIIAIDGSPTTSFTVTLDTGVITFNIPPALNAIITWGGDYFTPIRFDEGTDEWMQVSEDSFEAGSLPSINCIELIEEVPSSERFFYGGGRYEDLTADVNVGFADRVVTYLPDADGHQVFLPETSLLTGGGPYLTLINDAANFNFKLINTDGTELATVEADTGVILWLAETSTGALNWITIG